MSTPRWPRRPRSSQPAAARMLLSHFPIPCLTLGKSFHFFPLIFCAFGFVWEFLFVCLLFYSPRGNSKRPVFSGGIFGQQSISSLSAPASASLPGWVPEFPGLSGICSSLSSIPCSLPVPQPGSDPELCMAGRSTASSHSFTPL